MTNNLSKPQIRFKGFTEAWEQRKLGDISESYSGGTPTVGEKEYYDGNIPFIRSGEINSDKTELFLSENGLNNSSAKMVKIGDILYALYGATSGEVSISKLNGAINQAILAIQPHQNHNNYFLMQWLRKSKKMIIGTYLQGGQGNLSGNIVKELSIDLPFCDEQKLIGTFFNKLDSLITLHQRKLIFLKLHRFLMSVLFCYSWEQRKLGDIGKTFTGLSGKTSDDFGHGDAKFLPYLNIFNNPIADINFLESTEIDKSQNEIKYGDVFFTTSSETPEEVGMSSVWLGNSENIYLNSFCFGFRPLIDFNPYYFGYLLRSDTFRNHVTILAQGISRFNISKNKVMEIEIPLPEKQEQEKIGQLFYKLDSLITLHQRKQL